MSIYSYHVNLYKIGSTICLMMLGLMVIAQNSFSKENFRFETFLLPGGAQANQVQQVTQDQHGFLWFATKAGLIKYDGRTFKAFKHQPNNPNSVPINFVEKLLFDSNGMLWIGTYGKGIVQFDPELEVFSNPITLKNWITPYNHNKDNKNIYVYALEEDDKKNLWIGTDIGLFKYNLVTQDINYFKEDRQDETALNCRIIWNLYKDKKGTIWVGTGFPWISDTNAGGLHRYNPVSNNFTRFINTPNQLNSLADNRIRAIFEDRQQNFWVGTMGEGLHKMDRQSGTFERFGEQTNPKFGLSRPFVEKESYPDRDFSQVTFVHEDALGRLWIGAFNGGLNIYDPKTNQQLHFEMNRKSSNALSSNYLFSIFETTDNTIFLCTGDGGGNQLIKVNYSTNFFKKTTLPNATSESYIQNIEEDYQGNIWLGTQNSNGVFQWSPKEEKIIQSLAGLKSKEINALGMDQLGFLWIGYNDKGLELYHPKTNKIVPPNIPKTVLKDLSNQTINTVFEDSKGNTWIPKRENGVSIVKENGTIINLKRGSQAPNALSSETVDRILEDAQGNIWLFGNYQTLDGLYSLTIDKYDPIKNTVKSYLNPIQETGFITSVDKDPLGNFWFTNCLDGIKKFNPTTGEITTLNTSNSRIPSDEILAVLVGTNGIIWMSTENLIIAYHPEKEAFRIFNSLDGVSTKLWYGSIKERKNGEVLFGGQKGFLTIDPKQLDWQKEFKEPKIVVTALRVNNQLVSNNSKTNRPQPIWKETDLNFNHNENNFSLALSCLDYHEKTNYIEYYLENYDSYWRRVGPEQIAHYVNVPAGNYVFKTRGANPLGSWNANGQSIKITVKMPWWKTWWAYLSYALLGSGLIYFLYRFQLRRQAEQQEAQQLKEIDALKTKLYANITHEFRTPLTLILGQARQIQEEETLDQSIHSKVQSIEKNGHHLLWLVNQLLDIRKLEAKEERLNLAQGDIIPVLSTFADSFQALATNRAINYQIHLPHPPLKMDFDAKKLQKIVLNLISNAIKFTPNGGKVILFVQRLDNNLVINVKDTGIGIENSELPHIFNRFFRSDNSHKFTGTGIGLALTKELVELHKGQIQVSSKKGVGSEFIVKLPITNLADEKETTFSTIEPTGIPKSILSNSLPTSTNTTKNLPLVLIVEDNLDVARFTAACLKDKYAIHFAENGKIGIEKARELIPDLIISDVMMPEKNGFELCENLKQDEKTAHIPIILLTAKVEVEDKIAGLSRGADAYLAKPFHKKELNIRIKQLIQLREKLKERYAGLTLKKPSTDKSLKLNDEFILKVRAIIEAHLDDEQFGVEELSKAIFLSRAQVHRKIKALTGKSTGQFIHTVRLHHALRLLQESRKSITTIAFDVGYNDSSYFTRMFTREFGNPPSYYVPKEV